MIQCPIQTSTNSILKLSKCMINDMRMLRTNLLLCPDCPHYHNCKILHDFNSQISIAIGEVLEEFGYHV
jgi:hypothetical protein